MPKVIIEELTADHVRSLIRALNRNTESNVLMSAATDRLAASAAALIAAVQALPAPEDTAAINAVSDTLDTETAALTPAPAPAS